KNTGAWQELKTLDVARILFVIRSLSMPFKTAQTFLNCKKFSGIKRLKCREFMLIYLVRIFCGRIAGLVQSITLICVFNQKIRRGKLFPAFYFIAIVSANSSALKDSSSNTS